MASATVEKSEASNVSARIMDEKYDKTSTARGDDAGGMPDYPGEDDSFKPRIDTTHRSLKPRHIQLIGIGGYVDFAWRSSVDRN